MPKNGQSDKNLYVNTLITGELARMVETAMEIGGFTSKREFVRAALRRQSLEIIQTHEAINGNERRRS